MEIQLPDVSCTGCGACSQICSQKAIEMRPQYDGFVYPHIDPEKCIRCGRCMAACHALQEKDLRKAEECYAAQVKDKDILFRSTSGGLFYALASWIFSEGGVVYGCTFNAHYDAIITRFEALEQIAPVHGSKYVWSDSAQSYPEAEKDLKAGKKVLYTGLPCQAAGLKKYLGKPYPNLFLVDILCGGAPSPYAFQRYLETLVGENEKEKEGLHFQFRDKELFGSGVDCTYYIDGKKHHENYLENSFYFAFCSKSRITWRRSCYGCTYKSIYRTSDLTIGDYWGAEKYHKAFNPKDGISLVLVNTQKGRLLYESIRPALSDEKSSVSYAVERNSLVLTIEEGQVMPTAGREEFFSCLRERGWKAADHRYLSDRKKMIRNLKMARIKRKIKSLLHK